MNEFKLFHGDYREMQKTWANVKNADDATSFYKKHMPGLPDQLYEALYSHF